MQRLGDWLLPLVVVGLLLVPAAAAVGQPWDTYRGDQARTGVRGDLPVDDPVTWTVDLGPVEGSSPTVVDGVVYVGGSDDAGPRLERINVTDREVMNSSRDPGAPSVSTAGASVAKQGMDPLYAIDAGSGEILWTRNLPGQDSPKTRGIASDPVVVDGVIYLGAGAGTVFALDADSGETVWRHQLDVASDTTISSSPAVYDGTVYLGANGENASVFALDAATGQIEWTYGGGLLTSDSSPAVRGDQVYLGLVYPTRDGTSTFVSLDRATGELVWSFEHRGWASSTPLLLGHNVYFGSGDGRLYALDAEDGAFQWAVELEEPPIANQGVGVAPSTDGKHVYVGNQDRHVYALEPGTGEIVWKTELGGPIDSPPAVDDGRLYVTASSQELHVLNATNGDRSWSLDIGEGIHGQAPAVQHGQVFVANDDLYAVHAGSEPVERPNGAPGPSSVTVLVAAGVLAASLGSSGRGRRLG